MRATPASRGTALALGVTIGTTALAAPAGASAVPAREPLPPGLTFEDCPKLPAGDDPSLWNCNVGVISGGRLQVGRIDQAIVKPLRLTYAIGYDPETLEQKTIVVPLKGDPIRVDGGVLGIPGTDVLPVLQVSAKPTLAATPEFNVDPQTLLRLKLKIGVQNPLVGDQCAIGTKDAPVTLSLTVGTTRPPPPNKPITGSPPVDVAPDPPTYKMTLVDNVFAAPKATGCGPASLFNGLVDWRGGLPAKAGTNTAVFVQYLTFKPYTALPARTGR
ncbi:hypothetical protein [Actinomadura macra]|uniref:hypothetical protein n=1 Tax=Actinomadura macra TaxID=46164 RepID=UPI0008369EBA|nr:hypothetical protein [Actinomadura macra]